MDSQLYNELNKSWKSTCRILLGGELGELNEYEEWLGKYSPKPNKRISHISGKEITLSATDYCSSAKFISLEENTTPTVALDINQIKDLDTIVEAISEVWEYAGNKTLGNSVFIESSDHVTDSQYIYGGLEISKTSRAFECFDTDLAKNIFGGGQLGEAEFTIGFFAGQNIKRCFQSCTATDSSDLYFSHHLYGCHELIFSFHQRGKRHLIGNLQLPKDKYFDIKKKLLNEIREKLSKTKNLLPLFSIIPNSNLTLDIPISAKGKHMPENMKAIEKAFSTTFKVIFQKEPKSITKYETWLSERTAAMTQVTSPFGSKTFLAKHPIFKFHNELPDKRIVSYAEAMELGKLHIKEEKEMNFDNLSNWVANTMCFCAEYRGGENSNIIESEVFLDAHNVYKGYITIKSENVGLSSWPLQSKYAFGCHSILHSQFLLNCYSSVDLKRCFELESCTNCFDSMFCHNSEGLQDAMFCFNIKGKRHSLGNVQLPIDKYKGIKNSLIEQLLSEIEQTGSLRWDIFNIGCYTG